MDSHPEKRERYDRFGMAGVKMANTPMGESMLGLGTFLRDFSAYITFNCFLLILFAAFLSRRIDGKITWSYYLVFLPLLLADSIDFVVTWIIYRRLNNSEDNQSEDNDDDDDDDEQVSSAERDIRRTARQRARRAQRRQKLIGGILSMVSAFMAFVFHALIAIKVEDPSSVHTFVVFTPYIVNVAIMFVGATFRWAVDFSLARSVEQVLTKAYEVFEFIWWYAIRVAMAVLISLRIENEITGSWHKVFLPLYVTGGRYFLQILLMYCLSPQVPRSLTTAAMVLFSILASILFAFVGLLAERLDGHDYPMATVLIPVFVVLSIFVCCCGCCMPCLFSLGMSAANAEARGRAEARGGPENASGRDREARVLLVDSDNRVQGGRYGTGLGNSSRTTPTRRS
ncbi:hypothetical protein BGZ99_010494 [Dissophora globulifera]|uniref:Transmembrane protein n=1 Tax=Dissophora globulifera TaxID=979702 RepID=A0A9P6UM08_9FUNG|nr:hypothetical protein BGZ99_010494 [Dissophora globulifera]